MSSQNNLTIFGAGLAGLIAARMLQDLKPVVNERQESLPNNHHALLRFRSEIVSHATNIPFQKVMVSKAVSGGVNPICDANRYSHKVTGKLQVRSILDLATVERYIAPPDMIARLASTADIRYGVDFQEWSSALIRDHPPLVSTLPMPYMMDLFSWPDKPEFSSTPGWTVRATIKPEYEANINATLYYPGGEPQYRASITGSTLIIEGAGDIEAWHDSMYTMPDICKSFGIPPEAIDIGSITAHSAKYQKISALNGRDSEVAKRFVMWLSEKHNIYSLGRFATWRPKLLLDDLVQDVRVIRRLLEGETLYKHRM